MASSYMESLVVKKSCLLFSDLFLEELCLGESPWLGKWAFDCGEIPLGLLNLVTNIYAQLIANMAAIFVIINAMAIRQM